jgi:hypothetical protein
MCCGYGQNPTGQKSSSTAISYSIGATILPSVPLMLCAWHGNPEESLIVGSFILSASGVIIGPSMGHFYAGNTGRGFKSIGFRTISGGAFFLSSLAFLSNVYGENFEHVELYAAISIASGICTAGSILFDIFTCPSSVEKYNESILNHGGLYFTPEIDLSSKSYGIRLVYNF